MKHSARFGGCRGKVFALFALAGLRGVAEVTAGNYYFDDKQLAEWSRAWGKCLADSVQKTAVDHVLAARFQCYVAGVVDGQYGDVRIDKELQQFCESVADYLGDHPEAWREPAAVLILRGVGQESPPQGISPGVGSGIAGLAGTPMPPAGFTGQSLATKTMLDRCFRGGTLVVVEVKTQRAVLVLLLLAGVVLAGGLFYLGSGGEKPVAGAPEASDETTGGLGAVEEGFVGAAKQLVKKGGVDNGKSSAASGQKDGDNARPREDYLNATFRPLAALGVEMALARVRELPDAASRDMAMMALLGEWSGLTVTELAQRGDIGRFGVAGALALQLMNGGQISPQQAAGMADEFLSGDQRVGVLARSAEKLAPMDPTAALAMGEGLTDWQQVRFLSRFVSGWATADPDAARAWAMQVEDPRTRARLIGRVLAEQVKSDPVGAAQTFAQMPPDDAEARQRTARQIASQWAANDTLSAMQWSDSLPDGGDREAARQGIRSAAPIGIGARLSTGSDGVPVLDSLVPGSPASASGQLQSGDRVLAVADAGGVWVNSRNRPLGDVVGLIQGEPNTQVTLQVQSADGSPPRVVTLGREQIIFRPGS